MYNKILVYRILIDPKYTQSGTHLHTESTYTHQTGSMLRNWYWLYTHWPEIYPVWHTSSQRKHVHTPNGKHVT